MFLKLGLKVCVIHNYEQNEAILDLSQPHKYYGVGRAHHRVTCPKLKLYQQSLTLHST